MAGDILLRLIQMSQSAGTAAVRRNSALNPMLKLTAILTPLCFTMAYLFKDQAWVAVLFSLVGLVPAAITCYTYVYLLLKNPELLGSEEFRIQQQALQVIAQKGEPVVPSVLEVISNPLQQLGKGDAGQ